MTNANAVIDHNLLEDIDNEHKAYLLGWIAGVGIILSDEIRIWSNENDLEIIQILKDMVSSEIPIIKYENAVTFSILSAKMVEDVVRHLHCPAVSFPDSIDDSLKWDFVRGYFDCSGSGRR